MRIDGPQITGSFSLNGDGVQDLDSLVTTSSLNTYTSSMETTMGHVNTATHSLNTFTSSATTRLNSIEGVSGSYATTGSNVFIGTQTISGSVVPSVNNTYDLGSSTHQFRHIYISSGSLYIDGTKVLGSTSQELQITTDAGQSFKILEAGSDTITLQSTDGNITLATSGGGDVILDPTSGIVALKGTTQIYAGNKVRSSDGNNIVFGDGLTVSGSVTITGFIEAQELRTTYISSSILYRSGSTKFGDELTDTHEFTGSLLVSGSISIPGSGLISGSSQVDVMSTTNIARLATTGSNVFTGALSGTTATFSSNINIGSGGVINLNSQNGFQLGADAFSGGFYVYDNTTGVYRFKIANGGTATFSNDVLLQNGKFLQAVRNTGGALIDIIGIQSGSDTLQIKGGTSGGTNAINFYDTGGQIATFYNSNFGIGATTPTNKLEVDGGSSAVALRISTTNTGAGVASLILANSSKSAFNDGIIMSHGGGYTTVKNLTGSTIMTWDATNSRVGMGGLTNPQAILDVSHTAGTTNIIRVSNGEGYYRWRVDQNFSMIMTNASGTDTFSVTTSGSISTPAQFTSFSTSPFSFQANGNTGTYTQTAIYTNQNNTSGDIGNGIFIERGFTDTNTTEIRQFVIGARGGSYQWKLSGSGTTFQRDTCEVQRSGDGDIFIGRYSGGSAKIIYAYQSSADGFLELRTGANNTITKLSGYSGTPSYFLSNVGFGTTNPTQKLEVADGSIRITETGVSSFSVDYSSGKVQFGMDSAGTDGFYFRTYSGGYADRVIIKSNGNVGLSTTPSYRLHVSGDIYSTDTVYGRNISPTVWLSVTAGSPSAAGIPYGYSVINVSSSCDNTWRTILTNINDTKAYIWATVGDAASKDMGQWYMMMTSPAYGVSAFGNINYQDGGWNTGSFDFQYINGGSGTYHLQIKTTSYYSAGNTASGKVYFLRFE